MRFLDGAEDGVALDAAAGLARARRQDAEYAVMRLTLAPDRADEQVGRIGSAGDQDIGAALRRLALCQQPRGRPAAAERDQQGHGMQRDEAGMRRKPSADQHQHPVEGDCRQQAGCCNGKPVRQAGEDLYLPSKDAWHSRP